MQNKNIKESLKNVDPNVAAQIADGIKRLSSGMQDLLANGLKEDTIVILLHDSTKVGKTEIRSILRALPSLASSYLKPAKR